MIKGIIFDLDGTLLDTLEDLADSVNMTLEKHELPKRSIGDIRRFVGNGAATLLRLAMPEDKKNNDDLHQKLLATFKAVYAEHKTDKSQPYYGIDDMLETLTLSSYQMAVLSNKPHEYLVPICDMFFTNVFTYVYGQREGIARKPSKEPLLNLIAEMKLKPEEVLYVGDSEVDIMTARNAHVTSVAVSWGFRDRAFLESYKPDMIIDKPDELIAYLLSC